MKSLYLVEPQQDYGEFFLFSGLCEVLGKDNLVLYPMKLAYSGQSDLWYKLPNENKLGISHPTPYIVPRPMRIYPFEELVEVMNDFDLIVLSSPRYYPVHALRFIKQIFGNIPKPVAFVDCEDSEELRYDLIEEFKPQFVFKRELIKPIPNVHPMPFSSCLPYLPFWNDIKDLPKTLDVFALFGNTNVMRARVVKFLLEQNLTNSYVGIDTGALPWQDADRFKIAPMRSYQDYLKMMASAKINVIVRGHGRDTVRFWEAASFESLLLIKDPGIVIPHPYEDRVHCVYFDELEDLKEKIDYYLAHEDERLAIAKAGREHTMKYHTNARRAEQFLEIVNNNI